MRLPLLINDKYYEAIRCGSPHCTLGKNGITEEFISHALKLLKRYKIIKIKALKTIATRNNIKEIARKLSEATDSTMLDVRGKMIILSRVPIKNK